MTSAKTTSKIFLAIAAFSDYVVVKLNARIAPKAKLKGIDVISAYSSIENTMKTERIIHAKFLICKRRS